MWGLEAQEDYWSQTVWDSDNDEEDARITPESELHSEEEANLYAYIHYSLDEDICHQKQETSKQSSAVVNENNVKTSVARLTVPCEIKKPFEFAPRSVKKILAVPITNINEVYGTNVSTWAYQTNCDDDTGGKAKKRKKSEKSDALRKERDIKSCKNLQKLTSFETLNDAKCETRIKKCKTERTKKGSKKHNIGHTKKIGLIEKCKSPICIDLSKSDDSDVQMVKEIVKGSVKKSETVNVCDIPNDLSDEELTLVLQSPVDDGRKVDNPNLSAKSVSIADVITKAPAFVAELSSSDDDIEPIILPTDIRLNLKEQVLARWKNSPSPIHTDKKRKRSSEKSSDILTTMTIEQRMQKFYDSDESNSNLLVPSTQRVNKKSLWNISETDMFPGMGQTPRYYREVKMRVRCHNCKQFGHLSKVCPDPKRIPHCYLCGTPYHSGERCQNVICCHCMESGHKATECDIRWKSLNQNCNLCHMRGHQKQNCPDLWRRYYLTTTTDGVVEGSNVVNPRVFCYNCSEEGHWGHECHRSRFDRGSYPTYPFIMSYKIPTKPKEKKQKVNGGSHKKSWMKKKAGGPAWQEAKAEKLERKMNKKEKSNYYIKEKRKVKEQIQQRIEKKSKLKDKKQDAKVSRNFFDYARSKVRQKKQSKKSSFDEKNETTRKDLKRRKKRSKDTSFDEENGTAWKELKRSKRKKRIDID